MVMVFGEITTKAKVDYEKVACALTSWRTTKTQTNSRSSRFTRMTRRLHSTRNRITTRRGQRSKKIMASCRKA